MTDPQIVWSVLIAVQAILLAALFLTLKGQDMPSTEFTNALSALTGAYEGKLTTKQAELDAVSAELAALKAAPVVTDTGPQVDADDTAAIIAATPAA